MFFVLLKKHGKNMKKSSYKKTRFLIYGVKKDFCNELNATK